MPITYIANTLVQQTTASSWNSSLAGGRSVLVTMERQLYEP